LNSSFDICGRLVAGPIDVESALFADWGISGARGLFRVAYNHKYEYICKYSSKREKFYANDEYEIVVI
jgi:hypothetical protein